MARLSKIVRSNPLSNFAQVTPAAGGGFGLIADALETVNERIQPVAADKLRREGEERGRKAAEGDRPATYAARNASMARYGGPTNLAAEGWEAIRAGIFKGESGGDYDALFGYENRPGGAFSNVKLTSMTVDEALEFSKPSGEYGQSVKAKIGRVATPMGAYQVVGTTLRGAKQGMGLTGSEVMTPELQEQIGQYIYQTQGTGAWEGYRGPQSRGKSKAKMPDPEDPNVQVRTKDGNIELRKYSEFSGPLLQADTIAAQSAYQDTMVNQSAIDMAEMRLQFEFDPSGFAQTAKTYVDEIVKAAPDEIRGILRSELENEVERTVLGIQADKSRNVRQRASNANSALMDRFNTEYSDALISGDEDAILQSEQRLNNVMRVRENLPGSTWTMEDSAGVIFNTRRSAGIEAQRRKEREFKAFKDETQDRLDLAITAIKAGHMAEGEGLLDDPSIAALFPELVREGNAFRNLRDEMPNFMQMTPDQMDEAAAGMKSVEVQEEWQIDVTEAAGKTASENRKAWEADPVQRASDVLAQQPPDITGAIESGDPAQIMKAMTERRAYMNDLREKGYFENPTFFSETEAEALKSLFSPELPPEARAAMAAGISSAFGTNGVDAFNEIDGDSTTMYAGKLLSVGGSGAVASEIIRGKDLMREGIAKMPQKTTFAQTFNDSFADAFSAMPMPAGVRADIVEAAQAIYAARSVAGEMDDEASDALMTEAFNAAMGAGTNKRGEATGGVQVVFDADTAVPIGITADQMEGAVRAAFNGGTARLSGGGGRTQAPMPEELDLTTFAAASEQGVPLFNGKPIDRRTYQRGDIGVEAMGGQTYGLTVTVGGQTYDATGGNGERYTFKMDRLIEETR